MHGYRNTVTWLCTVVQCDPCWDHGTRLTRLQRYVQTSKKSLRSSQPKHDSNAEGSGDHPRSNRVLVDSKTFLRCLSDIPKGQALASRAWNFCKAFLWRRNSCCRSNRKQWEWWSCCYSSWTFGADWQSHSARRGRTCCQRAARTWRTAHSDKYRCLCKGCFESGEKLLDSHK